MGSIEYNIEGMEKFLPKTQEFFYVHLYQDLRALEADVTMCLENLETGEIRELWYRRVDENTEEEVENREFKKFFNEHYGSLNGRKPANVVDSLLIAEWWIPDAMHKQERLALYRRVEKHSLKKIAMLVLMLEDYNTCKSRELWHAGIRMRDSMTHGRYKEKLAKIVEEHFIALKGRDSVIVTVTHASEDSEWVELDVQEPGPDNKGMRGVRTVAKWVSAVKS